MKIEAFRSGTWRKQYQHRSFSPALINQEWTWDDPQINVLLELATRALGELNAFSLIVPNIEARSSNDLNHWVRFFLAGVLETAQKGKNTFQSVLALREEVEPLALAFGKRSPNARAALQCYYRQPVIWARKLETELQISQPTANALIQGFVKKGVLKELTSRRRNRLYVFDRYLQLFEK